MSNAIDIYTTTLPGMTFDIFQWNDWLQSATIPELYVAIAHMETLYIAYTERNKVKGINYRDYEENACKAHFYHRLEVAIYTEIFSRRDPRNQFSYS